MHFFKLATITALAGASLVAAAPSADGAMTAFKRGLDAGASFQPNEKRQTNCDACNQCIQGCLASGGGYLGAAASGCTVGCQTNSVCDGC